MMLIEEHIMDGFHHKGVEKWEEGFFADDKEALKIAIITNNKAMYGKILDSAEFGNCKYFFPMKKPKGAVLNREHFAYFYPVKPKVDSEMEEEIKLGRYEPRIDDVFILDGKKVEVVAGDNCEGCIRNKRNTCFIDNNYCCAERDRHDKQGVKYVEIGKSSVQTGTKEKTIVYNRYKIDLSWLHGKAREVISEAIQKKAFKNGCGWRNCSNQFFYTLKACSSPYLFIDTGNKELISVFGGTFKEHPFAELSVNKALNGEYGSEGQAKEHESENPVEYKFYEGQRVQFKSWEEMASEYSVDKNGDISCCGNFTRNMKHLCGTYATVMDFDYEEKIVYLKDFTGRDNIRWIYSTDMLKPASTKER